MTGSKDTRCCLSLSNVSVISGEEYLNHPLTSILAGSITPGDITSQAGKSNDFSNYISQKNSSDHGKVADLIRALVQSQTVKIDDIFLVTPLAYRLCSIIAKLDTCLHIIVNMVKDRDRYMFPSLTEHFARLGAFREMVKFRFPRTYDRLTSLEALSDRYLNKIFVGLFFDILSRDHAMRILDLYMICGEEILFQYGIALIYIFKKDIKGKSFKSSKAFWDTVKRTNHKIDFNTMSSIAFEDDRHHMLKFVNPKFSTAILTTLKSKFAAVRGAKAAIEVATMKEMKSLVSLEACASTWFDDTMWRQSSILGSTQAIHLQVFLNEVNLTPRSFEMVFNSSRDGFSIETMYECVTASGAVGPAILLLQTKKQNALIGVYLSCGVVQPSGEPVGDPTCFVFRLDKKPSRYFSPLFGDLKRGRRETGRGVGTGSSARGHVGASNGADEDDYEGSIRDRYTGEDFGVDEDNFESIARFIAGLRKKSEEVGNSNKKIRKSAIPMRVRGDKAAPRHSWSLYDQQQFVIFSKSAIFVGTNCRQAPECALKITSNLQFASSEPCETYGNEALVPEETNSPFELSHVELYCCINSGDGLFVDSSSFVSEEEEAEEAERRRREKEKPRSMWEGLSTFLSSARESTVGGNGNGGEGDSNGGTTGEITDNSLPLSPSSSSPTQLSSVTPGGEVKLIHPSPLTPLKNPLRSFYNELPAVRKLELLWDRVSQDPYPLDSMPNVVDPMAGWNLLNPSYLIQTFSLEADEIAAGRHKAFNTFGAAAKVTFKMNSIERFSGLFESGGSGIMRFSLAQPVVSAVDAVKPGIALKLLINGKPSVNIFATGSLDGQWLNDKSGKLAQNRNFFAKDLSTSSSSPGHASNAPLWMLPKESRPSSWETIPLTRASRVCDNGTDVKSKKVYAPVKLVFSPYPTTKAALESSSREDFRAQLATLKPGMELYKVLAFTEGSSSNTQIGKVVLESPVVASKYCDEHLFFRHPVT